MCNKRKLKKQEKFKKFIKQKKIKQKNLIKQISFNIFNVNSKFFIKTYLLKIINNNKCNTEIINITKNNIFNVKHKLLFHNHGYNNDYKKIIENTNPDFIFIITYLINNNFDKFYKFILTQKFNKNIFSFFEMCENVPELFSNIKLWYIFGCPLSTDCDICVVVDRKLEGIPVCPNYKSIVKLLKNVNTNKQLDFNFITIDLLEKRITSCKKGHDELVNILNETYKYHRQQFDLVELSNIKLDLFEKIRSIPKLIMDNLELLVDDYKNFRKS